MRHRIAIPYKIPLSPIPYKIPYSQSPIKSLIANPLWTGSHGTHWGSQLMSQCGGTCGGPSEDRCGNHWQDPWREAWCDPQWREGLNHFCTMSIWDLRRDPPGNEHLYLSDLLAWFCASAKTIHKDQLSESYQCDPGKIHISKMIFCGIGLRSL